MRRDGSGGAAAPAGAAATAAEVPGSVPRSPGGRGQAESLAMPPSPGRLDSLLPGYLSRPQASPLKARPALAQHPESAEHHGPGQPPAHGGKQRPAAGEDKASRPAKRARAARPMAAGGQLGGAGGGLHSQLTLELQQAPLGRADQAPSSARGGQRRRPAGSTAVAQRQRAGEACGPAGVAPLTVLSGLCADTDAAVAALPLPHALRALEHGFAAVAAVHAFLARSHIQVRRLGVRGGSLNVDACVLHALMSLLDAWMGGNTSNSWPGPWSVRLPSR
jgi:hypothetical protein